MEKLEEIAEKLHSQLESDDPPSLEVPVRQRNNIVEQDRIYRIGDRTATRDASQLDSAKKLLKMVYTMRFISQQVDADKSSTLRELYYLSESWDLDDAQFRSQDESNDVIEELETLIGRSRESFNMHPEESGAAMLGPLEIEEETRRGTRRLHLQDDVGKSGYTIPHSPDTISWVDDDVDLVLAVETGGMFDRLIENGFDEQWDALITHTKGQPARASRRVLRRLNTELDLPILVFCDGDPWSYRIFSSIAYGSVRSSHLADQLVTPDAQYLGVEPSDIREYDLPSDPLTDQDRNALESELDDPRFQSEYWQEQIQLQLELGRKSEQQSLASGGLDFVTDTYLPEKLEDVL